MDPFISSEQIGRVVDYLPIPLRHVALLAIGPVHRCLVRIAVHQSINTYRKLPCARWSKIEKHGHSVICKWEIKENHFTKRKIIVGAWVIDFKHKVVRVVFDIPHERNRLGEVF